MKLVFSMNYQPTPTGNDLALHKVHHIDTTMLFFMREVPDSILLTREQFNELRAKIAGDAWEAADLFANEQKQYPYGKRGGVYDNPNKQQYLSSLTAVPLEAEAEKQEFLPPDHGDICWTEGAETFTRKEVYHLLWTQRAMIGNDLKSICGHDMTTEMYEIIDSPRIPKF